MKNVTIEWLGHSCMAVEEDGYRVVFDPYKDGSVDGLAPMRTDADLVLCSHEHGDHAGRECVKLRGDGGCDGSDPCPFSITELHSFHDDAKGAKRGLNTIRILDDGTYRIAHMGDIGCMPTPEQMEALRNLDVMLVPVGGFYTMEPDAVRKLVAELAPKTVVPMHYRSDTFGYPVIGTVDAFTALFDNVCEYDGNELNLPADLKEQIAVLKL